jgi:hypothetical protein
VEPGKPARLWWVLTGSTPAGTVRTFELVAGAPAAAPRVEAVAGKDAVEITCDGAKVLRYNVTTLPAPEGVESRFTRGGYIHPAWTPAGLPVTDDFPPDHRHQHGIWMAWTKTEFEGRHLDIWNLGTGTATARCVGVDAPAGGPVFAGFRAKHELVDLKAPGGEKVALNEGLEVRVWRFGGPRKAYFLWDFTSTQACATASPVSFPQYYYGGMGFRGTAEWMKDVRFLTSEGKDRKSGDNTTARWVALCGPIGGKRSTDHLLSETRYFPYGLRVLLPGACRWPTL